uniref:Capsid protein n=1 Tax=viral metagenome TaxID=1070528 RepID=A0A2V0RH85_9ZZZZ
MRKKSTFRKVADTAGKVEIVAKGVKNTASELDNSYGNDGHRATRSARPSGVIVRARDSILPDIGARIFVDPLDDEKTFIVQGISVNIGDPETGSIAATYIRDYVYPAYNNAIIQGVKYDTSGIITQAKLAAYHKHILSALAAYYFVSYQKAFISDSTNVSSSLNARDVNVYGPATEEALKVMRNRLQSYCVSPNMIKLMDWLFQLRPSSRTPNANLLQFCDDTNLITATDDDTLSVYLRQKLIDLDDDDGRVSSTLGKVQPDWQIRLQHYSEMNSNPSMDFNWLNIWMNFGVERPAPIDNLPYNSMKYVLSNDNPNAICTALATIYDSTNLVWDPGLVEPKTAITTNVYIANSVTGAMSDLVQTSSRLLGSWRYYDYVNGTTPIDIVEAMPESASVEINAIDLKPDTQSMLKFLYNLDTIQNSGISAMKNLVTR